MKIHPFAALYPRLELVVDNDSFFGTAKHKFPEFVSSGFYKKSAKKAFYIFSIQTNESYRSGIIANTDIEEIRNKTVLPHEQTLASKEQNVMHLMLQRKAMIKPVLLGYDASPKFENFVEKVISSRSPLFEIPMENGEETHRYWLVDSAKDITYVSNYFSKIKKVYIADGHHRCTTAVQLYNTEKIKLGNESASKGLLSAFIPFSDVKIYDFNRVIDLEHKLTYAEFIVELSRFCKIKRLKKPKRAKSKYTMTMFLDNNWFLLEWKKSVLKKYEGEALLLDATLFNDVVISKILKIDDIRTTSAVSYKDGTKGTLGIEASVTNESQHRIGFCLPTMSIKEFKSAADNKIFLPPKSTYFVPRIRNGMLVKEI